ncbi:hypothetical protein DAEQUDRAFT_640460, partial [Daedalea quercina L-15889]
VDLYDSGTSDHMSPYCDTFLTFRETVPRSLNTANQQMFQATGVRDMVVNIPNG